MSSSEVKIACLGMTHLGLIHATAFADKGFVVVGYDTEEANIEKLNLGLPYISEPDLKEKLNQNKERLIFTNDLKEISSCDLVFISYDVPTNSNGTSDLNPIIELLNQVGPYLSQDACLIILSQVPPVFTRKIATKFPQEVFYQVETLIFGKAISRALYPERYIVGVKDKANELPSSYQVLLSSFDCPILKMNYESAELAKISINMFLVSSVTTTNTLAEICENINADWNEIVPALQLDKRIGQYAYLKPGLGISGGNLERDLTTVMNLGAEYNTDIGLVESFIQNSSRRKDWVTQVLRKLLSSQTQSLEVCILGLAYKENTHSIKNSPSIHLIEQFKEIKFRAHDPVVTINYPGYKESIEEALHNADVVIIMTPWEQYKRIPLKVFENLMRGDTIIDPYRILNREHSLANFNYFTVGAAAQYKESLCSNIEM
jgi:UDPglucose 6-dehydrogenase